MEQPNIRFYIRDLAPLLQKVNTRKRNINVSRELERPGDWFLGFVGRVIGSGDRVDGVVKECSPGRDKNFLYKGIFDLEGNGVVTEITSDTFRVKGGILYFIQGKETTRFTVKGISQPDQYIQVAESRLEFPLRWYDSVRVPVGKGEYLHINLDAADLPVFMTMNGILIRRMNGYVPLANGGSKYTEITKDKKEITVYDTSFRATVKPLGEKILRGINE